jgi:DNA primase
LCPFHGSTNETSPPFSVEKTLGIWMCFNPTCEESGNLTDLVRRRTGQNPFQVQRTIIKYRTAQSSPIEDRVADALAKQPEFVEFDQELLNRLRSNFKGSKGEEYMHGRGFNDDTLDTFEIGYSAKKNMVVVPMHDPNGMPVGMIGRIASNEDKRFKNTNNLPKSKTAWNFHRAKKTGDTVIICEASFDAMRIHQAGYPNVIALLGGHVSAHHLAQIGRVFSTVIIMTDYDGKRFYPNCRRCSGDCIGHRPGRDLGRAIVKGMTGKRIKWAAYDDYCVFPHGAKDAGDMTDDEIRQCLRNAVSNLEYSQWNIEELVAS